jgi:hypothetical protein
MNTIQTVVERGVFEKGTMKGKRYTISITEYEFIQPVWDLIKEYMIILKEKDECCGKNCDETNGLKLGMGWNRFYSSVADMIQSQLWCEYCYTDNTGRDCKGCSEYYPYTEMTYKVGDAFGEACYCYDQYFCKMCVDDINSIDYDP